MIACVIPARLNSSRFPGKLLAVAGGKTVLQRTFECALQAKAIDRLFVATDSERIADHVHAFGGVVVWTSSSCSTGTERIAEAFRKAAERVIAERGNLIAKADHSNISTEEK